MALYAAWNSSSTNTDLNTDFAVTDQQNSVLNGSSTIDRLNDSNFSSSFINSTDGDVLFESWSNMFDEKHLRHSLEWTITLFVAYTLIFLVGLIGNLMVILVVRCRPQMRSVTHMFIMNLAVADLLVTVFCVPSNFMSNAVANWLLRSFLCKGVTYVQGVSVCASAYSLAAISVDRCKGVNKAFKPSSGLSKTQALKIICLIWTFSSVLIIPWAVKFDVTTLNQNKIEICVESWANEQHGKLYFLIANFLLCYCTPLLIICVSHLVILSKVCRRKVPPESASTGTIETMHRKSKHSVLKMLGVVTFAFLLSWLPLYIIVMIMKFGYNINEDLYNRLEFWMSIAQWIGISNSCINPMLYAFFNTKFRKMFSSFLPAWMICKSHENLVLIAKNYSVPSAISKCPDERANGTESETSVCLATSSSSKVVSSESRGTRYDSRGITSGSRERCIHSRGISGASRSNPYNEKIQRHRPRRINTGIQLVTARYMDAGVPSTVIFKVPVVTKCSLNDIKTVSTKPTNL